MRLPKILLTGLIVGLAGCSGSGAVSSPAVSATTSPAPPPTHAGGPDAQVDARAAATQFNQLYFASKFGASWDLLAATAKSQIPKDVWVGVHAGCTSASGGLTGAIKAVTLFGNAAIVTEIVTGAQAKGGTTEYVFNYSNGNWRYSPDNLSIYRHGSVAADIRAAKSAGFCASWKSF